MLQIRLDLLYRFTIAEAGSGLGNESENEARPNCERRNVFIVLLSLRLLPENTKQVVIIKSNVGENYLRKSCPPEL
jgi:hypothetical protein